MIPLFKPKYYPESFDNVKRVMESGWTGLGPETSRFEEEVATYLGARYVVALNSGTEALRLALNVANIPKNSLVITTPNTFVSTNHVILEAGNTPIFADIDLKLGSLSVDSVYKILQIYSHYVKALMLVHYGGTPAYLDDFRSLASKYNFELIEDCAHAFGARYKDNLIGSSGNFNCFSFHTVKPLSSGEGGAFVTRDERLANEVRKLRWLGIDKSTFDRTKAGLYSWEYDCPLLGYKSHMSDIAAAIGRGQLIHVDEDNITRANLVERYRDRLGFKIPIFLLSKPYNMKSSNHLFVVRFIDEIQREKVMVALKKNDIQYGHHYKNNMLYPMYQLAFHRPLPNMELWNKTALSLPLNLHMTLEDVDFICDIVLKEVK